jgi:hypothetical protein
MLLLASKQHNSEMMTMQAPLSIYKQFNNTRAVCGVWTISDTPISEDIEVE